VCSEIGTEPVYIFPPPATASRLTLYQRRNQQQQQPQPHESYISACNASSTDSTKKRSFNEISNDSERFLTSVFGVDIATGRADSGADHSASSVITSGNGRSFVPIQSNSGDRMTSSLRLGKEGTSDGASPSSSHKASPPGKDSANPITLELIQRRIVALLEAKGAIKSPQVPIE
jgi:hypothetical protein